MIIFDLSDARITRLTDRLDIYQLPEYISLYSSHEVSPFYYYFEAGGRYFLLPGLLQKIEGTGFFDFETPYGYGGIYSESSDHSFLELAFQNMKIEMMDYGIIDGLIRFNPLSQNSEIFRPYLDLSFNRNTVVLDLELDEEQIWEKHIHSKHRNVIKKAMNLGLQFEIDSEFKTLDNFVELYLKTMVSLEADYFYFFNKDYFQRIKLSFRKNSFIANVKLGEQIIASAIFLYKDNYAHYHLACSDKSKLDYYPNNFLIFRTALYLKSQNIKCFHLGGGSDTSSDNSLLKFKKRFSKDVLDFFVGKIIPDEKTYSEICRTWELNNPNKNEKYQNFLQKYRC